MADPIKASFDIAFENPFGTVVFAQDLMTVIQGIGTAPPTAKTVGVGIGSGFLNRIETEQVQRLHGPIGQGRNSQGTKFGGVAAFRNVHAPQRLWLIAVAAEFAESGCFQRRSVPDVAVHSGGG